MGGNSWIDEMVTGTPGLDSYARRALKVYAISCFIYAGVCILIIAFLLWAGSSGT